MKISSKIQDYAIIGNGRSAALVSRNGSIDWLCWRRFDSPPLFGSLLDRAVGGSWRIQPTARANVKRRYSDETNVLETRFENEKGAIVASSSRSHGVAPVSRRFGTSPARGGRNRWC